MLNEAMVTKDEQVNAALAHASVLLGFFSRGVLGLVFAFLIWITQRGKSRFVARQAAQAVVYQLVGLIVSLVVWIAWIALWAGAILMPLAINPRQPEALMPFTIIPAILLISVPLTIMLAWSAYGLYAAWAVWHGRDFSYPIIGEWIK